VRLQLRVEQAFDVHVHRNDHAINAYVDRRGHARCLRGDIIRQRAMKVHFGHPHTTGARPRRHGDGEQRPPLIVGYATVGDTLTATPPASAEPVQLTVNDTLGKPIRSPGTDTLSTCTLRGGACTPIAGSSRVAVGGGRVHPRVENAAPVGTGAAHCARSVTAAPDLGRWHTDNVTRVPSA
jgi:hypothetical protein